MHETTLFRKFGSKRDLIAQAIDQRLSNTPLNQLTCTGQLKTDLLTILQAYEQVNAAHGTIIPLILFEAARNPELETLLQTPLTNIQAVVQIIEQHQQASHLKQGSPLLLLASLIGPIMVTNMFRRATPHHPPPNIDLEQHVNSFLHGHTP